ncbi:MAG: 6-carboxytetrahydropterin synthase [Desulfovibrionaceae bacterium]|nr:6-carboxytetrahydropterin synthase [Desulfovibrionaceae bacterium]
MIHITCRHSIAIAHRIFEYDGSCERLHGHNYRIEIGISAGALDSLGMIADFRVVKKTLYQALDEAWDHRTLLQDKDPLCASLQKILTDGSVCPVPFNPTAENMAAYLATSLFPDALEKAGMGTLKVCFVTVFETDKNSATWTSD